MKAAVVLPKRLIYQSDLASVPENRTMTNIHVIFIFSSFLSSPHQGSSKLLKHLAFQRKTFVIGDFQENPEYLRSFQDP